ncbi:MAG: hypothetical protein K8J08_05660 [Thermoanaerobaculia bacterium]|nr:hypothetical protein [Thermoanaerobaculia bacterium]
MKISMFAMLLMSGSLVVAQAPPSSDVFVVDAGFADNPDLAVNPAGDFVVVWNGVSTGDDRGISAQRLDSEATFVGPPLDVNENTDGVQSHPVVAMKDDGTFVVAWKSVVDAFPDDLESIQLRRFGADGLPLAGEVRVDTLTTGARGPLAIGMAVNGDFVVVWESGVSAGTDNSGTSLQGQLYLDGGTPMGGQFQVNTETAGDQEDPDVAMRSDGTFIVAWTSGAGSDLALKSQQFLADGSVSGGEVELSPGSPGEDYYTPAIGVDGEGALTYVAVSGSSVKGFGRRFSAAGGDLGYFLIGVGVDLPGLAVGEDRKEVGVWTNFATGEAMGMVWGPDGSVVHDQFLLNPEEPEALGFNVTVAIGLGGGFLAIWETSNEILGRLYLGEGIFTDGFESGDLTAWSPTPP